MEELDLTKLRQKMIQARAAFPQEKRTRANQSIQQRVLEKWKPEWKVVLIYVNRAEEVCTTSLILELLEREIQVCVPAFDPSLERYFPSQIQDFENEMESGRFGILEPRRTACRPVPAHDLDAVFLPGVAFDANGNRLGYGYGYFDRICRATRSFKVGLAYQFQIVERLTPHSGDVPMNQIVTEEKVLECHAS